MTDKNVNAIEDFDTLDQPFNFKYQGANYRIPSFDRPMTVALMDMQSKFGDLSMDDDEDAKKSPEEVVETNKKHFDIQDEMIVSSVLLVGEDDKCTPINNATIEHWSLKVKTKVMSEITEQMSFSVEDEDTEKKL